MNPKKKSKTLQFQDIPAYHHTAKYARPKQKYTTSDYIKISSGFDDVAESQGRKLRHSLIEPKPFNGVKFKRSYVHERGRDGTQNKIFTKQSFETDLLRQTNDKNTPFLFEAGESLLTPSEKTLMKLLTKEKSDLTQYNNFTQLKGIFHYIVASRQTSNIFRKCMGFFRAYIPNWENQHDTVEITAVASLAVDVDRQLSDYLHTLLTEYSNDQSDRFVQQSFLKDFRDIFRLEDSEVTEANDALVKLRAQQAKYPDRFQKTSKSKPHMKNKSTSWTKKGKKRRSSRRRRSRRAAKKSRTNSSATSFSSKKKKTKKKKKRKSKT